MFTFSNTMPHGVYEEETGTTAHALYAYPLAAAALVAVDVPSALIYTAWNILMIPYVIMK